MPPYTIRGSFKSSASQKPIYIRFVTLYSVYFESLSKRFHKKIQFIKYFFRSLRGLKDKPEVALLPLPINDNETGLHSFYLSLTSLSNVFFCKTQRSTALCAIKCSSEHCYTVLSDTCALPVKARCNGDSLRSASARGK
jgi:hypothetical protein